MKKILKIVLLIILLMGVLFILTACANQDGKINESTNSLKQETLSGSNTNKIETTTDYSKYKGIWQNPADSSIPDEELIIKSIENDKITFDYEIYRLTSFENGVAILKNNIATFDIKNEMDWNIKGQIELKENSVIFTIKEGSNEYLEPSSITFTQKSNSSILQGDTLNNAVTENKPNATIYVGTTGNFKKYEVIVYEELSPQEQAEMLINEIGYKLGYQIMIKEITSGKGGMTIDFDPDSAPFDLKNTYKGNGEEEYKVSGEANIAYTIFDSIKETLQKYFGASMDVYMLKDGKEINIKSVNPAIRIKSTEPYKGSAN